MGNDWAELTKEAKEHGGPDGLRSHCTNEGVLGALESSWLGRF